MIINLANTQKVKFGSTEVKKIKKGSEQIWPEESSLVFYDYIINVRTVINGTATAPYINTLYTPSMDTAIEAYISGQAMNYQYSFLGVRQSNGVRHIHIFFPQNASNLQSRLNFSDKSYNFSRGQFGSQTGYKVKISKTGWSVKNSDDQNITSGSWSPSTVTFPGPITIFALNNNGKIETRGVDLDREIIPKLYYVKFWENDVLVRHWVPATFENEPGMYDLVNEKFYGNDGESYFLVGNNS